MKIKVDAKKELKREIAGILFFFFSLIMFASLIAGGRYVGKIGQGVAQALLYFFGKGAFLIPAIFVYLGILNFVKVRQSKSYSRFIGFLILILNFPLFLDLLSRSGNWGGFWGNILGGLLRKYFGSIGAFLVVLAVFSIGIILTTELSMSSIISGSFRKLKELLSLGGQEGVKKHKVAKPKILRPQKEDGTIKQEAEQIVSKEKEERDFQCDDLERDEGLSRKESAEYRYPPFDLLIKPSHDDTPQSGEELKDKATILEKTLGDFEIPARVTQIVPGPVITQFEIELAPGIKVSSINNLAKDLSMALQAETLRVLTPIPGKAAVGIEIPSSKIRIVALREIVESKSFSNSPLISFALGKTVDGKSYCADIESMPHLLIAGATGSGKSVCIHSIILSLLFKTRPKDLKLLLIDPKRVELSVYNGIPHLLTPVITNPKKAAGYLSWVVGEMEQRYRIFADRGVRDIFQFNERAGEERQDPMPFIVIIIDELADLMAVSAQQVEQIIIRLAQLSRAVGIHLILATQRPSVNVITGIIKANLPARISFQVISKVDSRTILDMNGAENLLGNGDMLYLASGAAKPIRLQGCYVSPKEVARVVNFIKSQNIQFDYIDLLRATKQLNDTVQHEDELFREAVEVIINLEQASVSLLQRKLKIGYNRAARLIEIMEQEGIVGPLDGVKGRKVLVNRDYLKNLEHIQKIE